MTKIAPPPERAGLIPYASEGGHWYTKAGVPAYEVVGKNGEVRQTTMRDARIYDLVPSVTTIMKCAASPFLEHWKREQLMMSALTLPRIHGETLEELAARIAEDAAAQAIAARDTGTIIHNAIEKALLGENFDVEYNAHVQGALVALNDWCGLTDIEPEKSFAHEMGFGGKVDANKYDGFEGWVADYKTKDFGMTNLPKTYETHDMQLGAYRNGFGMPYARCAIIFVSTSVPGLTHLVEIPEADLQQGWEMFVHLLRFWQTKNRFGV